ncbi:MAG: hypothetical protein ACI3ZL_04145 [Candidatus Cryptobacteroides sp.]
MTEDWTDLIGESLRETEETLPADDWSVLQQKYDAVRKKRRKTAMAWVCGIMSVAAAAAIVLIVVRDDTPVAEHEDIIAEAVQPMEEEFVDMNSSEDDDFIRVIPDKTHLVADVHIHSGEPVAGIMDEDSDMESVVVQIDEDGDNQDVENNDNQYVEKIGNQTVERNDDQSVVESGAGSGGDMFFMEDSPEEKIKRHRRPVTVGLSASVSGIPEVKGNMDMSNLTEDGILSGKDTSLVNVERRGPAVMKKQETYLDSYSHHFPISVGLSFRFGITDRLSINTGLNYTRYVSTRERTYIGIPQTMSDRQYAHYLGIPVRLDWMPVNRKRFNFYVGAGFTMDKCIYAVVGGEKLNEKQVLFGVGAAAGIQVNLATRAGLFLEPEISYSINKGSIETYRSEHPLMLSARAGLRFNF